MNDGKLVAAGILLVVLTTLLVVGVKAHNKSYYEAKDLCEAKGGYFYAPHKSPTICLKPDQVIK